MSISVDVAGAMAMPLSALDTDNRTNSAARWEQAIIDQQAEIAQRETTLVNINLVILIIILILQRSKVMLI